METSKRKSIRNYLTNNYFFDIIFPFYFILTTSNDIIKKAKSFLFQYFTKIDLNMKIHPKLKIHIIENK
jgi:hypothetical protein